MKKFLCVLMMSMLLLVAAGCGETADSTTGESENGKEQVSDSTAQKETDATDAPASGTEVAVITVKDYGTIEVELNREAAPITVDNFVKLVNDGFYDGLTFHRIISGFMIQGGDPLGDGTGGADTEIKGEFAENGVENPILHKRGTISMARSMMPDSASSQFFIVHQDSPHLDGAYAGFGSVISGMEVVDAICEATPVMDGNGTVQPENQPVIESIVMQ